MVCLVPAVALDGAIGGALMFLVLGGCMVPRLLGTSLTVDALHCTVLLVAAWAALLDWYVAVPWLDLVVHAMATGLLAVMVWHLLHDLGVLSHGTGAVAVRVEALAGITSMGALLALLWEIGEWLGHTYLDPAIQVGYDDTVTDLLAGVVGAFLAGVAARRHVAVEAPASVEAGR
ncbi:hypothetical protein FC770_09875 [Nocardioides jishulii]|uniref:DUF2238 domain-containing protein n=1 Tax=Nocardioides jishulii TaxID=2575440 RepID=A0A4U2YNG4_9ACTN|nr:hypothetical protein FCL41_10210 [Nocardioides jishulii]TKI62809.1 hypothetical protein FC770_09875 [Nocardioides jishulii]